MVMKQLFCETPMSKFKVLEAVNAFLGFYIVMAFAAYMYLGSLPDAFVYLTPALCFLSVVYHINMSFDLRKSMTGSGSLLNLRFVSSAGITFALFFLANAALVIGCVFSLPVAFIFALLFVLDHALYISIDKNQISQKNKRNESIQPLTAA